MSWSVVPVAEPALGAALGLGLVVSRQFGSRPAQFGAVGSLVVVLGLLSVGLDARHIDLLPAAIVGAALVAVSARRVESLRPGLSRWLISGALLAASLATPDVEPTLFAAALIGAIALASTDRVASLLGRPVLASWPGTASVGALASWAVVVGSRGRPPAMVGAFGCFVVLFAVAAASRSAAYQGRRLVGPTAGWVGASLAVGIPIARHLGLFATWSTPLVRLAIVGAVTAAVVAVGRRMGAASARRSDRASVRPPRGTSRPPRGTNRPPRGTRQSGSP
ncbi:MAG: hypothetical protein HKN26_07530 [Acidimicrobiales bacterium]|nr:hypothetical protein [Acidimicrobiales bacterium]